MSGPTREDTYAITVTIFRPTDPTIPLIKGVWDKMSGGEIDSEESKYNPGAMEPPVSLGGRKTVGNVTVSRLYRLGRDHIAADGLIRAVGKSKVTISKQPLDIDGNADPGAYPPIVYNGILKRVSFPAVDSEGNGAGLIEIEVSIDGYPTA